MRFWWALAGAGFVAVLTGTGVGGTRALAPTTAGLVALLTVVVPIVAFSQARLLEALRPSRLEIYRSSMVSISVLCVLVLADGFYNLGLTAMRLAPGTSLAQLFVGVGLGVASVAVIWVSVEVAHRVFGLREPDFVRRLLPQSRREKWTFFVLSILAGVGEEIAYRGFLLTAVALWSGSLTVALIVSSMTFGLAHAYQATPGILRTGLLGLLFGACVLMTDSLVPAIVAHTLIDWIMGLWLGPRILGTAAAGIDPNPEVV